MKKLKLMLFVVICLSSLLIGCNGGSTFNGNKVTNADSFQMEYSILNQQEDSSLMLLAGDSIQVAISQKSGTVDVIVGMDGNEPVYEGNNLTNMGFTLNVNETGTYKISVIGHNACGSVVFTKIQAETRDE